MYLYGSFANNIFGDKMLKTVYRIAVMYFTSVFFMRIAGKRAVAQLEVSELVTSFMVSEIACMPITDPDVSLLSAIIYSATVIAFEIILTKASIRKAFFKHMVIGKPDFLVVKGKLDADTLKKADVSLSELVSAMRKEGIEALDKVNYAIQEPDGTISMFASGEGSGGVQHMLVCDGRFNKSEMKIFGYSERDVENIMLTRGIKQVGEVFYLGIDDDNNVFVIKKEQKTKDTE